MFLRPTTAALVLALCATCTAPAAPSDTETTRTATAAATAATAAPGPAPDVGADMLSTAISCHEGAEGEQGIPSQPVLLVHGTGLTPKESWKRTYVSALTRDGFTTCTAKLPNRALDDAQVSSEYVVYALRTMYARYGDAVNVITHSQGALEARWAIKFWPDIRDKIDDLIMLSGSNHGTLTADVICLQRLKGCTESVAQQRPRSRFLAALNNGDETPGDVDYTSIFSYTDEIVITRYGDPSPALEGASNIAVQSLCKFRPVQHIAMITSAPVYALVRDALDHDGPAERSRVDRRRACRRLVARDMQPISGVYNNSTYLPAAAAVVLNEGRDEPALMPYAKDESPADDQSSRSLLAGLSSLRR